MLAYNPTKLDLNRLAFKTITGQSLQAEWSWTERWLWDDIGPAGGHGRAIAAALVERVYDAASRAILT